MEAIIDTQDKKGFIQTIYKKRFTFYDPSQAINESNSLDKISSEIYSDPKRFLVECIQNCDDSSYENGELSLKITLRDQSMIISHKGKPFDEEDIDSLCSSGKSTKIKEEKSTGYKGIGFKSIFKYSEKVILISGGYQVRFDKNYFDEKKCWQDEWGSLSDYNHENRNKRACHTIKKPWQIIPIWTEKNEIEDNILSVCKDYNVNLIIYFKNQEILKSCQDFIKDMENDHIFFLFLKSQKASIRIYENSSHHIFEKKPDLNRNIISITISDNKKSEVPDSVIGRYFIKDFNINIEEFYGNEKYKILGNEDVPDKYKTVDSFNLSFAIPVEFSKSKEFTVINLENEKRIIYSFLPTKVNYNFPFVINCNMILDASRTHLAEDNIWNMQVFSILPRYITEFQRILFENLGNSYTLSFVSDSKITCTKFNEIFKQKSEEQYIITQKNITIKTKTGYLQKLSESYINDFKILSDPPHESIESFFEQIYETKSNEILTKYFSQFSIIYDNNYEFDKIDLKYLHILLKYYNTKIFEINSKEIIKFLKSDDYKKNYTNLRCYKFISGLKDTNILEDIKKEQPDIFYDQIYNKFRTPGSYLINSLSSCTDNHLVDFKEIKIELKHPDCFEFPSNLLGIFEREEERPLLNRIGVKEISEKSKFEYIVNNLKTLYNEDSSVEIIQIAFNKWITANNDSEKKQIIEKFKFFNLHSHDKIFMNPYCMNIGEFYSGKTEFSPFTSHSVSEYYYIQGTNKEDWVKFFTGLELWIEIKTYYLQLDKEKFANMPYIDDVFKQQNLKKFNKTRTCFWIYINPSLEEILSQNLEGLIKFYNENCLFFSVPKELKETDFLNYFAWFIKAKKKKIPTLKNNLKEVSDILSYSILEEHPNYLQDFIKQIIDFPLSKDVEVFLQKSKLLEFRKKMNKDEIKSLLDHISSTEKLEENNQREHIFKEYFQKLLNEYLKGSNNSNTYTGKLLDTNYKFKNPSDLYYFLNDEIKIILTPYMLSKSELLVSPKEINKSQFINFCKSRGVKVYEKIKFEAKDITEEHEFMDKARKIFPLIERIMLQKNYKASESKLNELKVYSSKEISIKTEHKERWTDGISYYDKIKKITNIYFLKDDVYTDWRHTTIIWYLTKYLAFHFECAELHPFFLMLFIKKTEEEANDFIDKVSRF